MRKILLFISLLLPMTANAIQCNIEFNGITIHEHAPVLMKTLPPDRFGDMHSQGEWKVQRLEGPCNYRIEVSYDTSIRLLESIRVNQCVYNEMYGHEKQHVAIVKANAQRYHNSFAQLARNFSVQTSNVRAHVAELNAGVEKVTNAMVAEEDRLHKVFDAKEGTDRFARERACMKQLTGSDQVYR
jgi:hypothetical protein